MDAETKLKLIALIEAGDLRGAMDALTGLLGAGGAAALYEQEELAYWLKLIPDLDTVTVIVRRYGKLIRTLVLENPGLTSSSARRPAELQSSLESSRSPR